MTDSTGNRRPIATRDAGWVRRGATALAARGVSPNHISQASILCAALAGGAFWTVHGVGPLGGAVLLVLGAVFCQARLMCNLLDGLVAVEGGLRAKDGPFWNEAPDRAADILILVGFGLGAGQPALGWAAAAMAVLTAYVRELGRAEGMAADFSGPLAKPQRMALVTFGAVIAAMEPFVTGTALVMTVVLWVLILGTGVTALRRAWRLIDWMRARPI
jgi:phosphatidylglycerophosphate synthase